MPSKHPKHEIRRDVLAARAAELRAERWTQQAIADELGVSRPTVVNWLTRGREMANEREADAAAKWRDDQVAEMVKVQEAGWAILERMRTEDQHGIPVDYKAATALGQIVNAASRIARLRGLDAPQTVDLSFQSMDEETARKILEEDDDD